MLYTAQRSRHAAEVTTFSSNILSCDGTFKTKGKNSLFSTGSLFCWLKAENRLRRCYSHLSISAQV